MDMFVVPSFKLNSRKSLINLSIYSFPDLVVIEQRVIRLPWSCRLPVVSVVDLPALVHGDLIRFLGLFQFSYICRGLLCEYMVNFGKAP